ncbi:leucine-rich repeat-containing protein 40 [Pieris napi]|uniref:leucine-rich repeat-containing protein 40 n=1 Tax=Pieris napi TaxID=78633 RepID=UPI001FBA6996|nr:leucine-rich repeat-containing protein 40 [Pieris napi]
MALKVYFIVFIVWIVNCKCDMCNVTQCDCPFNITVKESGHQIRCCDIPMLTNKTFRGVEIEFSEKCDFNNINFDVPILDTFSIIMTNNTIVKLRINVKANNLRELNLSLNRLQYISKDLFSNYTNLRVLILSKNSINKISAESFVGLTKLEKLDLSENNLTKLENIFTPLKSLQHLNLSRNNIEFILENYFNNWLLQHLDVSHNNLRKLAPGALQLLPNLARLLLTDNPHLGITQLDTQLLVGTGRRLQQIDASRTGLYQVPEAFTHSVRFLSLVGNHISSIRCGDLDSYPLLQSLDFSNNKIKSIEEDSLGRLEMLLFLNLNNNSLIVVPKSLPDELKYLSINNNMIKNLTSADFKSLPNLRILLLKSNKILYIQDHVFDDLLSLEILDLSNNPLQMLSPSTFDGPLSLRDLRLCYLNISVPAKDGSFPMSSPESVQMLHLQSSPGLARQFLADSAALAAFSHLQYLDLRMNNLRNIRNDLLFYLVQLKTLRLHGNKINCSAELWLSDWMNWNKSLLNNETCYYSTSEAKAEINKYNCTFPETFTINESLPPVNLYSTEMINKLLRYYGYLNNKTERSSLKRNYNNFGDKNNRITLNVNDTFVSRLEKNFVNNTIRNNEKLDTENMIQYEDYYNRTGIVEISKIDKNITSLVPEHLDAILSETPTISENRTMLKTGNRLNTPVATKASLTSLALENQYALNSSANNTYTTPNNMEYSHYQPPGHFAQYFGIVSVSCLIVMSLVLWLSIRLRYKRRHAPSVDGGGQEQIEVSNISGGVLW